MGEARGKYYFEKAAPRLDWLEVWRQGEHVGDILAAFELFLMDGVERKEQTKDLDMGEDKHFVIPKSIAPIAEDFTVEVGCVVGM